MSKKRVERRTLADGTVRTYRYGPRDRKRSRSDTVNDLILAWERSPEWRDYSDATKAHHTLYLKPLGDAAGRVNIAHVDRRSIIDIRNVIAERRGNGAAAAFAKVTATLFAWAVETGRIPFSPASRMKRLKGGYIPAWTESDATLALAHLPEHFRRAVVLALYTGQRRGDLIRLTWADYDGQTLRLVQKKTGERLVLPCHPSLRVELDLWRSQTTTVTILSNAKGKPWVPNNLTTQLGMALAAIPDFPRGKNIHGLRKLAAALLAEAGCSTKEIMAITGHRTLAMVDLYTKSADQVRLASAAIIRFGRHDKTTK